MGGPLKHAFLPGDFRGCRIPRFSPPPSPPFPSPSPLKCQRGVATTRGDLRNVLRLGRGGGTRGSFWTRSPLFQTPIPFFAAASPVIGGGGARGGVGGRRGSHMRAGCFPPQLPAPRQPHFSQIFFLSPPPPPIRTGTEMRPRVSLGGAGRPRAAEPGGQREGGLPSRLRIPAGWEWGGGASADLPPASRWPPSYACRAECPFART